MKITRILESTAFHEAGHAIASVFLKIPFTRVTIIPNEADMSLGHISHPCWYQRSIAKWLSATGEPVSEEREAVLKMRLEHECVMILCGGFAEKKLRGRRNLLGSGFDRAMEYSSRGSDFDQFHDLASRACGMDEKVGRPYREYLTALAEALVKARWTEIELLAAALLEKKTMNVVEVRRAIFP